MARRKYTFKPLGMMGTSAEIPLEMLPSGAAAFKWTSSTYTYNFRTFQGAARKRPGYIIQNSNTGVPITIGRFRARQGTPASYPNSDFNFFLTPTDLCQDLQSTQTGHTTETFTYLTDTGDYDDSVASISGDTVTFKSNTIADTEDIAVGDKFILDTDHTADEEPDTNWAEIQTVNKSGGYITSLVLTANYSGTTGSWPGAEKDCLIRRVYTGPGANGSWSYATVNDLLIFCNPNDNVQVWDPDGTYASALDSTNAKKWNYCTEYANRCILANEEGVNALSIKWSKEGDPTDWTDDTAGSASLQTQAYKITGLAKLGAYLLVFTPNSYLVGYRTGIATSPIAFQDEVVGVGAYAPNSIVSAGGTVFFMGQHDFYKMEGLTARPIGAAVKNEIFSVESPSNVQLFKGAHNARDHEIWWWRPGTQHVVVYDYIHNVWNVFRFASESVNIYGVGTGMKELNDKEDSVFTGVASADLTTTTRIHRHDLDRLSDNGNPFAANYRTRATDFSDQDPEAFNRWKTVYGARLVFKDLSPSVGFTIYVYAEDTYLGTMSASVAGSGSSGIESVDIFGMFPGNRFEFAIYDGGVKKKVEIHSLDIFYELGGEYFPTS